MFQVSTYLKNNPSAKGLLISLFAVFIAFGIYFQFLAKKNQYVVDNATPEVYYFKINNQPEKIIAGGQYLSIDLKKGKNRIKVFNEKKQFLYDSAFTVSQLRGLINIGLQDYYINTQYYGYNLKKDSLLLSLEKTKIDGKDYFGAPKYFNGIFTDDFYYNVDEEYDPVIKNIADVESRTKIFRKQDFLNYYKEYYKFK